MAHDFDKGLSQMKSASTSIKKMTKGASQKSYSNHSELASGKPATAPKKSI